MRGNDVTDEQWQRIAPLLPAQGRMGRPRADDRKVLNGILYVLRTGCRWKDMPQEYGSYSTAWRRLERWQREGVWDRIWQRFLSSLDEEGKLDWARAFLDGSFAPAKRGEKRSA
jgi:transposase